MESYINRHALSTSPVWHISEPCMESKINSWGSGGDAIKGEEVSQGILIEESGNILLAQQTMIWNEISLF